MDKKDILKKKEIKLDSKEHQVLISITKRLGDLRMEMDVFNFYMTNFVSNILRVNKEIPSEKWEIDMPRGMIVEKGVPIIGDNNNGNNPK